MSDLSRIIAIIALIVVTVILIRGLKSFFLGSNIDDKRKSNKLMQLRVIAQFVAIVILMTLFYFYKAYSGS
ncbi:MAG: twin transmembrane helix small protein [Candidatus Fonsibacter ubiquis]|nr:twin transmembrane helix small protein [Candidatus Fonsibacter ubiquis]